MRQRNALCVGLRISRVAMLITISLGLTGLAHGQVRDSVIKYSSGQKLVTIECFVPNAPGKHPAVLLLHGSGGLEQATGAIFREFASTLADRGYVALIPHYFEKTDHVIGKPLQGEDYRAVLDSLKDAIEFAATQPEVDANRFAIIGYSMGSNLAMVTAARDPRVKAIVSVSGSYPPIKPSKKLPPLLILHGSKDKSTPVEYVKKYQEGLKEQEMPHAVHIYNGMGHNFDNVRFEDVARRSAAFFDRYLKAPEPAR